MNAISRFGAIMAVAASVMGAPGTHAQQSTVCDGTSAILDKPASPSDLNKYYTALRESNSAMLYNFPRFLDLLSAENRKKFAYTLLCRGISPTFLWENMVWVRGVPMKWALWNFVIGDEPFFFRSIGKTDSTWNFKASVRFPEGRFANQDDFMRSFLEQNP